MPFEVDENKILQPLGVKVLRDSRFDLLPATRDYFETIPGRDGEFDFGAELEAGALELHCVVEATPADWPAMRRMLAAHLDPRNGVQTLIFADEPGKVYMVRYSGKIPLTKYPFAREFTIPFRMSDPAVISTTQNTLTGSGTAINAGTEPTPFTLTIVGPVTDPSVMVGGYVMSYVGTVASGKALIVDTGRLTAIYDNANALANYNNVFPKLRPGDNEVVAASGGITIINWLDRWI